ncbi:MAG: hypothetical protein RBS80_04900 [Thermoguttaceae bacterium]|jgi:hypothetical protein|nr:hypothetical protein [Thermoguttaceae bacterium]
MGEAFDAYHKWLGIPPKDQPPHHYRLLALDLFESDPDVIDAAASKQMSYLRNLATGPHVALSQRLLNEIAAVRICLLNPEKKATYDDELRERLGAGSDQSALSPAVAQEQTTGSPVSVNPVVTVQHGTQTYQKSQPWLVYVALGAGVLLLAVLLANMMPKPDSDGGIGTIEIGRGGTKDPGKLPPPKLPKPPVDPPDPPHVPAQQVHTATSTENGRKIVEPAGDGIASPGEDGPSSPQSLSLEPPIKPSAPGTSTEDDEPVSPSNVEDTQTIPPPPPDAEDQLTSPLAEAKSPEEFRSVAEKALRYVDQAILNGDSETAKVLMTWAVAAAREAKDDALSKTATLRYLEVQVPLSEEVIEGARKRWETWKPPLRSKEEASSGMVVLSDELVAATAPPQRSLADLVWDRQEALRAEFPDESVAAPAPSQRSLADLVRDRQEALQSMQAGDNQQLTTSTPHLIQSRTNEWNGSSSDYAQHANRRFSVGMGSENRNGYGQAGIEIEGLRELEVTVERTGRYTGWDANDFAGFIIDYHTASGYSKRVALSIGFHNKKRSGPGPPWGTGGKFDESHDLGNHAAYTLKLGQWAPLEWNGRIWFTVMLQNAGTNSALSAVIVSPSEWEAQP